jgi:hypothetical protein
MGIQSQQNILFKSVDIDFDLIIHPVWRRYEIRKSRGEVSEQSRPTVAINANLLGYTFVSKSCGAVGGINILASSFAQNHVDVKIVCVGPCRHHSKRATVNREVRKATAKIRASTARRIHLSSLILEDPNDEARIRKLQAEVRRFESQSERCLPENFAELLKKLEVGSDESGSSVSVTSSIYQADPEIDAIINGDSDFVLYIGASKASSADGCNESGSVGAYFMLRKQSCCFGLHQ